jgi:hypothetical protein
MAFLSHEIERLKALSDEMAKLIENKDTSNEAVVAFGRIGNACTKAIALDAALTAKRTTRTDNVTRLRTARENRRAAKKGNAPSPQGQGSAQQTASRQRTS